MHHLLHMQTQLIDGSVMSEGAMNADHHFFVHAVDAFNDLPLLIIVPDLFRSPGTSAPQERKPLPQCNKDPASAHANPLWHSTLAPWCYQDIPWIFEFGSTTTAEGKLILSKNFQTDVSFHVKKELSQLI